MKTQSKNKEHCQSEWSPHWKTTTGGARKWHFSAPCGTWIIKQTQRHVKPGKLIYFRKSSPAPHPRGCCIWFYVNRIPVFFYRASMAPTGRKQKTSILWREPTPSAACRPLLETLVYFLGRTWGLSELWKQRGDKSCDVFLVTKKLSAYCLETVDPWFWRDSSNSRMKTEPLPLFEFLPSLGGGYSLGITYGLFQDFQSTRRIGHWVCGYSWPCYRAIKPRPGRAEWLDGMPTRICTIWRNIV